MPICDTENVHILNSISPMIYATYKISLLIFFFIMKHFFNSLPFLSLMPLYVSIQLMGREKS